LSFVYEMVLLIEDESDKVCKGVGFL
jgi:hypothetical protein